MPILYVISLLTSLVFAVVVFFGFIILPSCITAACAAGVVSTFTGPTQPFYFDDVDRARSMRVGAAPIPRERALVEVAEQPVLPVPADVEQTTYID